jgi:competence protein ComEA
MTRFGTIRTVNGRGMRPVTLPSGLPAIDHPLGAFMFRKLLLAVTAFFATLSIAFAAVDVNTATKAELDTVPGIGPALADRIIDERKKGAFKDVNDLTERVRGIGPENVKKMQAGGLTVGGRASAASRPSDSKKDSPRADSRPADAKKDAPKAEKAADAKKDAPKADKGEKADRAEAKAKREAKAEKDEKKK